MNQTISTTTPKTSYPLIDTHTHFDLPVYDNDRQGYIERAVSAGVEHLLLIGYKACYFERLLGAYHAIQALTDKLTPHLAVGLHPLYIAEHSDNDLVKLEQFLTQHKNIAIAEIGLDSYPSDLGNKEQLGRQADFFSAQLEFAKDFDLPVALHIRKSHADTLKLLKQHKFTGGGIAHSFSGGEQEAMAFIKLGFKIGLTGQLTNPNAKKLHRTVKSAWQRFGLSAFVIETDCPDMTPITHQNLPINEPSLLPCVAQALSEITGVSLAVLSEQLWENSENALRYQFCKNQP